MICRRRRIRQVDRNGGQIRAILDALALKLGYPDGDAYNDDCEFRPAEVARRLKAL